MNWRNAAIGAAGATAGALLTPVALTTGLGAVGFSAAGPVASSTAARVQAGIGNVVAESLFATAQSISMGGTIPPLVTAVGGGVGAAAATGASTSAASRVAACLRWRGRSYSRKTLSSLFVLFRTFFYFFAKK